MSCWLILHAACLCSYHLPILRSTFDIEYINTLKSNIMLSEVTDLKMI